MNDKKTKRAVAYCRVSTDSKDQNNSYQEQQKHFKSLFAENPDIEFKGLYADRGLSGTKLYRPEFDRMLQDAGLQRVVDKDTNKAVDTYKIVSAPAFDYIYVTNISRFARNISADSFIKTLALNKVYLVYVDFSGNEYSTETEAGEKTIIDELVHAERFSRDLSAKVKFGMKQGAKDGHIFCGYNIYGYTYVRRNLDDASKGNYLVINEPEAEIVRTIFDMYCNQLIGTERIARILGEQGIFTRTHKRFSSTSILGILKNEKYCGGNNAMRYDTGSVFGDRRTKHIDYDNKVRQLARQATAEQIEQGIIKIPPIISVELWQKAQEIRHGRKTYETNKGIYHGKTDFAGLIVCGKCGCTYQAAGVKKTKDKTVRYYSCRHRYRYDTENGVPQCYNPSISEVRLNELLSSNGYSLRRMIRIKQIIKLATDYRDNLLTDIDNEHIEQVSALKTELADTLEQKDRLLDLYMKGKCSEAQYDERIAVLNESEDRLRTEIGRLSQSNDDIYRAVAELNNLIEQTKADHEKMQADLNNGKWAKAYTRKELLLDIDKIVIGEDGEPTLIFRSLNQLEDTIKNLYNGNSNYDTPTRK